MFIEQEKDDPPHTRRSHNSEASRFVPTKYKLLIENISN